MGQRGNPDRALVRNAADPDQVRRAERVERDREEKFRAALAAVLQTVEGRYVFGELLERGRVFETSFDHSGSVMTFREGRRNFALEIMGHLVASDEDAFDLLERERRERRRLENRSTDAAHTPRAEQAEG